MTFRARLSKLQRRRATTRFFSTTSPSHQSHRPPLPGRLRLRLQALSDRSPRFLRRYINPLLTAPVTHATSFFVLHELTAIIPLFGLAGAFHYFEWVPGLGAGRANKDGDGDGDGDEATAAATNSLGERAKGDDLDEGTRRFSKWLSKRGWIGEDEDDGAWGGDSKRLVLEFATAYAITKFFLPLRIIGSVWATPWFARAVVSRMQRRISHFFKS